MPEPNDEIFIQQCLQGDREAFGMLVSRHQRSVFNVALRMTKSYQEAQDITQAVFIKAYENLASYDTRFKFFSWIYRMAVNEALNNVKRSRRFEGLDPEHDYHTVLPTPEIDFEENEMSRNIQNALMFMKVDYRALIILKHLQGLSYEEIAYVMEIPEKTVKSRLFTARQMLKEVLLKRGYVENDR